MKHPLAHLKQLFPDLFWAYSPKEQLNAFLINYKFKCEKIIWSIKKKQKRKWLVSKGIIIVILIFQRGKHTPRIAAVSSAYIGNI